MASNTTAKWMGIILWIPLITAALTTTGIGTMFSQDEGRDWEGPDIPVKTCLSSITCLLSLGCRRAPHRDLLENPSRRAILDCVTTNPGIGFRELARKSNISTGALRYHLDKLCQKGVISRTGSSEGIAIFPGSQTFDLLKKKIVKNLRSATRGVILRRLREEEACTRKDLALYAGISTSGISWHMKKLTKEEIVVREKEGRATVYRLAEGVSDLFCP